MLQLQSFFYYLEFTWRGAWKFLSPQHFINTSVSFMSPLKFFYLTSLKTMYFLLYKLRLFFFTMNFIFLYKYALYFLVPPFSCENITLIFVHIFISSEVMTSFCFPDRLVYQTYHSTSQRKYSILYTSIQFNFLIS
jgi:hypothetical protein